MPSLLAVPLVCNRSVQSSFLVTSLIFFLRGDNLTTMLSPRVLFWDERGSISKAITTCKLIRKGLVLRQGSGRSDVLCLWFGNNNIMFSIVNRRLGALCNCTRESIHVSGYIVDRLLIACLFPRSRVPVDLPSEPLLTALPSFWIILPNFSSAR